MDTLIAQASGQRIHAKGGLRAALFVIVAPDRRRVGMNACRLAKADAIGLHKRETGSGP
ncbi:MAG: hypothetical protein R8K47_00375 [Mariprofundaceae bacterium]